MRYDGGQMPSDGSSTSAALALAASSEAASVDPQGSQAGCPRRRRWVRPPPWLWPTGESLEWTTPELVAAWSRWRVEVAWAKWSHAANVLESIFCLYTKMLRVRRSGPSWPMTTGVSGRPGHLNHNITGKKKFHGTWWKRRRHWRRKGPMPILTRSRIGLIPTLSALALEQCSSAASSRALALNGPCTHTLDQASRRQVAPLSPWTVYENIFLHFNEFCSVVLLCCNERIRYPKDSKIQIQNLRFRGSLKNSSR
jgi:hypothetical protein